MPDIGHALHIILIGAHNDSVKTIIIILLEMRKIRHGYMSKNTELVNGKQAWLTAKAVLIQHARC